jgi:hypothetical protein
MSSTVAIVKTHPRAGRVYLCLHEEIDCYKPKRTFLAALVRAVCVIKQSNFTEEACENEILEILSKHKQEINDKWGNEDEEKDLCFPIDRCIFDARHLLKCIADAYGMAFAFFDGYYEFMIPKDPAIIIEPSCGIEKVTVTSGGVEKVTATNCVSFVKQKSKWYLIRSETSLSPQRNFCLN